MVISSSKLKWHLLPLRKSESKNEGNYNTTEEDVAKNFILSLFWW